MSRPKSAASAGTYTPGYRVEKVLMILFGVILCVVGLWKILTPLRLLVFGQGTRAEVLYVIKTKPDLPDQILRTDPQLQANVESRDRSYVFFNEFGFHTRDGRPVEVRAPVGSKLAPLYPLFDSDGLPTSDLVYYDPRHPETVVFPLIVSSWFAPGMMILIGLVAVGVGSILLYWADKPITLPHIPATGTHRPRDR
jgi:hypothetical protein